MEFAHIAKSTNWKETIKKSKRKKKKEKHRTQLKKSAKTFASFIQNEKWDKKKPTSDSEHESTGKDWVMSERSLKMEAHRARQRANIIKRRSLPSTHRSNSASSTASSISAIIMGINNYSRTRTGSTTSIRSIESKQLQVRRMGTKLELQAGASQHGTTWGKELRENIEILYDYLCGPKEKQEEKMLKPAELMICSKMYDATKFCSSDEARAQIEMISGKHGDQSCDKDHFVIYLEKCLLHCGEYAPDIVNEWIKELKKSSAIEVSDTLKLILKGSQDKSSISRHESKKSRGLFSRIFGRNNSSSSSRSSSSSSMNVSDRQSSKRETKKKSSSVGVSTHVLRRRSSSDHPSLGVSKSLMLGKPSSKFDHSSYKRLD